MHKYIKILSIVKVAYVLCSIDTLLHSSRVLYSKVIKYLYLILVNNRLTMLFACCIGSYSIFLLLEVFCFISYNSAVVSAIL